MCRPVPVPLQPHFFPVWLRIRAREPVEDDQFATESISREQPWRRQSCRRGAEKSRDYSVVFRCPQGATSYYHRDILPEMSLLCMFPGTSSALPAFVDADTIRRTDCRTAPFTPRHPANPPSLMSCRFLVLSMFTGRIPIHRDALVSHRHGRTVRRSFPFWFILGPHTQSGSTVVGRAHSAACRVVSRLVFLFSVSV